MAERSYHHGNLRAVLLDLAEETLRADGVDALSLRELARQARVSHSAPHKHFIDRQALLNALAERGFTRLTQMAHDVMASGQDYEAVFRDYAACFVRFAASDAALMELMFAIKIDRSVPNVTRAAAGLFATFDELVAQGRQAGYFQAVDVTRLRLLFIATLQGTVSLLASRRITSAQADVLVSDAVTLLLRSPAVEALR